MKKEVYIVIISLLTAPTFALAQFDSASREGHVPVARVSAEDPAPNTPEWLLTLDVIKNKADDLMQKNFRLEEEHESLVAQYKQVATEARDLQIQNEQLKTLLKERRGRTDQQAQIDELNAQIKAKEGEIALLQKNLDRADLDHQEMQRKLGLKRLKIQGIETQLKARTKNDMVKEAIQKRAAMTNDEELNKINEKLQFERDQEELLVTEIKELKAGRQLNDTGVKVSAEEIKALEAKAESLRSQKEGLQKELNGDNNQTASKEYLALLAKQKDLEAKIKEFEDQLVALKEPQALGLWDPKQKKQMVRQMVQIDTRNSQVRQKIAGLKENVSLLKEQVGRLERRVEREKGSSSNTEEK